MEEIPVFVKLGEGGFEHCKIPQSPPYLLNRPQELQRLGKLLVRIWFGVCFLAFYIEENRPPRLYMTRHQMFLNLILVGGDESFERMAYHGEGDSRLRQLASK